MLYVDRRIQVTEEVSLHNADGLTRGWRLMLCVWDLQVEELALRATIRAQQQGSEPPQPSALQLLCATQEETRRCVDDADSLNRMALQLDTMPFGNQCEQEMEEQDEEEDEEEEVVEDDYEDDGDED
ncbi:snRNA-activating protein complex subunit 5 isoform X1 [Lethenteron reissneri]|uniref:snRNA-activating protein complex subunit 5 isoform X1 n=1 Tax=Lethenteron reissneri TaxID=7753 RepID=UPI002AB72AD6|nr:snRNA-activating protein complex subunit 5 isoform X1 [Lethenteron reissneri]